MGRRLVGAMLVAAGVMFGATLDRCGRMETAHAATQDEALSEQQASVEKQLKELGTQVKDINTLLHSGTLRVVVVINPNGQ